MAAAPVETHDEAAAVEADLRTAERDAARVVLWGRTLLLGLVAVWLTTGVFLYRPTLLLGLSVVLAYMIAGLLLLRLLHHPRWRLFALALRTADIAGLGVLAVLGPLAAGADVPQIFVFRSYGIGYLMLFIALGALSLSPFIVIWSGLISLATLWGSFAWIVSGMDRTVSWRDFPEGGTAADYAAVLLDPDFIGTGNRVEDSFVIVACTAMIAFAVHRARRLIRDRVRLEQRRRRALEVFGQFVPEDVAARLLEAPDGLTPRTLPGSVLFADIAGFTRFSEHRPPAEVIGAMNAVFEEVTRLVSARGGVVTGFAGDAAIAAFTAGPTPEACAEAAIAAGQAILAAMEQQDFAGHRLAMRVGIASGPIAAGAVGGRSRRAYTIYGDPVNLAQRLQAAAKSLGVPLLVCEGTWSLAGRSPAFADRGALDIPGRDGSVRAFSQG